MIIQKEFINKLRDFGLNSYESKLWTALLSRGVSTAGELSDMAGVPRSRTYDVLESLEKKGFVLMKIGKPIKYLAIPPGEVVIRVKKNITDLAQIQTRILDGLKNSQVLTDLNSLYDTGITIVDPAELAGSIKGRDNLYNFIERSITNANKSVIIMTTAPGLIRKQSYLQKAIQKAHKKGVSIRIVAPLSEKTKAATTALAKYASVRTGKGIQRFFIIDSTKTIFPLMDDKDISPTYDTSVWVESKFFASSLENMFNTVWKDLKK